VIRSLADLQKHQVYIAIGAVSAAVAQVMSTCIAVYAQLIYSV
jgi:hypothetical protein